MLNILIPMAGSGLRFQNEGYSLPKPLIDIAGRPMIQVVIENLRPQQEHQFIFICQNEHLKKYQLNEVLKKLVPHSQIIGIDGATEGAACTVLKAKSLINSSEPLMIANCDQYIKADINSYLKAQSELDGLIMTMTASDSRWSFAKLNSQGLVTEVREKQIISNQATVGIYNFKQGKDFVQAAEQMIEKNIRVNNEFYVAPVYNELIEQGKKIGAYNIGNLNEAMFGIGTPEDLKAFLSRGAII